MDLSPFGLKMKRGKGLSLGLGVLHRVGCLAKNMGLKWGTWPMLGSTQMTKWGTWPKFSIFIWHKCWIPPEMTKWGTWIMLDPTRTDNHTDDLTAPLCLVHNNCPGTSSSPRYTNILSYLMRLINILPSCLGVQWSLMTWSVICSWSRIKKLWKGLRLLCDYSGLFVTIFQV